MELEHPVAQDMWEKVGTLLKDGKEGGALKNCGALQLPPCFSGLMGMSA